MAENLGVTVVEDGGGITPRSPGTETGVGHPPRVGGNPVKEGVNGQLAAATVSRAKTLQADKNP